MKKYILLACTAAALVGCKPQGGTEDEYGTTSNTNYSRPIERAPSSGLNTNTNQGSATSPGGTQSGTEQKSQNGTTPQP